MQSLIAKKSNEALQAGYEAAKHRALVSGLELARTGAAWLQNAITADMETVAHYEAEIAARIQARIAENKAIELNAEAIEAAYWERMDAIADAEDYKIAQLEKEWEQMVATGEAEEYGWED